MSKIPEITELMNSYADTVKVSSRPLLNAKETICTAQTDDKSAKKPIWRRKLMFALIPMMIVIIAVSIMIPQLFAPPLHDASPPSSDEEEKLCEYNFVDLTTQVYDGNIWSNLLTINGTFNPIIERMYYSGNDGLQIFDKVLEITIDNEQVTVTIYAIQKWIKVDMNHLGEFGIDIAHDGSYSSLAQCNTSNYQLYMAINSPLAGKALGIADRIISGAEWRF